MVLKYRFLGKGYTDENGVAHMTEDADGQAVTGYTGTGRGLTDIIASTDDSSKISDSSLLSERYSLIDGTFCDKALDGTGNYNPNWTNMNNRFNVSRDNEGTLLTSNTAWAYYQANNNATFSAPLCVEFDVVSFTETPSIRFRNNNASSPHVINETGHYKIVFGEDSIQVIVNGLSKQHWIPVSILELPFTVYFEASDVNESVKYRNFVIYPV